MSTNSRIIRKKNRLSLQVANLCRGHKNYNVHVSRSSVRYALDKLLLRPTRDRIEIISGFNAETLLKLPDSFTCLRFFKEDAKIWESVVKNESVSYKENMLLLATSYIAANALKLKEFQVYVDKVNGFLFEGKQDELRGYLDECENTISQSICYLRTYLAAWHEDPTKLKKKLGSEENSSFISKSICDILVNANVYTGSDQSVDDVITLFNADFGEDDVRTHAVNFILGKTEGDLDKLSKQLFICMRSHPYDIRTLILTYFETKYANSIPLTELELTALKVIDDTHSCFRSRYLRSNKTSSVLQYTENVDSIPLLEQLDIEPSVHTLWADLISSEEFKHRSPTGSNFLDSLIKMRTKRYPNKTHYNKVMSTLFRFKHTSFGKFLKGIVSGFYLLQRTSESIEVRDNLRLMAYLECMTIFTLASPRGMTAATLNLAKSDSNHLADLFAKKFYIHLLDRTSNCSDRFMLKRDMWELKWPQRELDYTTWFSIVREKVKYKRPYYTGISWRFLEKIERRHRIDAFAGNPDAYYALLIWVIESKAPSSNKLRQAIRLGGVRYDDFFDFLYWLLEEFKEEAHLFLMEYCSPQILMKMRFADTYVEALTIRIQGLSIALSQIGETVYLNWQKYKNEENAFVASALLSSIGKNRFSVGWDMFKADFLSRKQDSFRNVLYFINDEQSEAKFDTDFTPYEFNNGFKCNYSHNSHKEYLCDKIILDLFDAFISHPSQGIEAILSIRIRHNHFRKEFSSMFEELKGPRRSVLNMHDKRQISEEYEQPVLDLVKQWLDDHMATARSDKPDAIFKIFPTDEDYQILRSSINFETLDTAIDGFVEWMKVRLKENLVSAQKLIKADLLAKLRNLTATIGKESAVDKTKSLRESRKRISAVVTSALEKKCHELESWFVIPEKNIIDDLSSLDIRELIYKNYYQERKNEKLTIHISDIPIDSLGWSDEKLRIAYYLFLEIVENAKSYGCSKKTVLYGSTYVDEEYMGIYVSNKCDETPDQEEKRIVGHPYIGTREIFTEGDTGLGKIAYLAASLVGEEVSMTVKGIGNRFRMKIPIKRRRI